MQVKYQRRLGDFGPTYTSCWCDTMMTDDGQARMTTLIARAGSPLKRMSDELSVCLKLRSGGVKLVRSRYDDVKAFATSMYWLLNLNLRGKESSSKG